MGGKGRKTQAVFQIAVIPAPNWPTMMAYHDGLNWPTMMALTGLP